MPAWVRTIKPSVIQPSLGAVEGAHEFFANGILVHNCDGLVWLIQAHVNQGLELPKIQWIET